MASKVLVPGSIIDSQMPWKPLVLSLPWEDVVSGWATKETTTPMWPAITMMWLLCTRNLTIYLNLSDEMFTLSGKRWLQITFYEEILRVSKSPRPITIFWHGDPRNMSSSWWTTPRTLSVLSHPINMPRCPLTTSLSYEPLNYALILRRRNTGSSLVIWNGPSHSAEKILFMILLFSRDTALSLATDTSPRFSIYMDTSRNKPQPL